MSGFGPLAEELHAIAVDLRTYLGSDHGMCYTEEFYLFEKMSFADLMGDCLASDEPAAFLRQWMKDVRSQFPPPSG